MKKLILYSAIFLCSCEPGTTYKRVVQNDSDFDISIIHLGVKSCKYVVYDTSFVTAHSEALIGEQQGLGQTSQYKTCRTCTDSISVTALNNSTAKLNLDLNNPVNWSFKIFKKGFKGGGACECRLILTNDHFK